MVYLGVPSRSRTCHAVGSTKKTIIEALGHETFPLRYGWLKKAFDAVAEEEATGNERSVFLAADAIARFGVGRNMVGVDAPLGDGRRDDRR